MRRIISLVVVIALVVPGLLTAEPSASAQTDRIVLVAGNASPPSGDRAMLSLLEEPGLPVDVIDDDDVIANGIDLSDVAMVAIATSVNHGNLGDLFKDSPVPVLLWEGYLADDMGMGDPAGESASTDSLVITDSASPLAGGLTGTVAVTSPAQRQSSAVPGPEAMVAATLLNNAARSPLFMYDAGATLFDGTIAANCRTLVFPNYPGATSLTNAGQTLVRAAIATTLACDPPPPPPMNPPTVELGDDIAGDWEEGATLLPIITDPDPDPVLTAAWSQIAGPAGATFDDPTALGPVNVTVPGPGLYTFELIVTDEFGLTGNDTIVFDAFEPLIDGDSDGFFVNDSDPALVDCNDGNPAVFPGAPEIPGNDVDEDCDGEDAPLPTLDAVMLSGTTSPPSGDEDVLDRLIAAGYDVTIVDDDSDLDTLESTGLDGVELLVITSSVVPSKVGDTFAATPIPVLIWENYLFRDMKLSNERVTSSTFRTIEIVDDTHPIAAGLSGTTTVYDKFNKLSYGMPNDTHPAGSELAPTIIAHVPGEPDQAVITAYEQGDELLNGDPAPERRVMMFPDFNGGRNLSTNGIALFDAAIAYLSMSIDNDLDDDGFEPPADCDDTNPAAYPGAPEIANNGVDEDCDGEDLVTNPPVVDLGDDQTGAFPDGVTIIADVSDPDPDAVLSGQWTQESGPTGAAFSDSTALDMVDVTLPGPGTYVFKLTVTDETNLSGSDTMEFVATDPLTDGDSDGFFVNDPDPELIDCDDSDPAINPAADDIPENGIDEDCDGEDAIVEPLDAIMISGTDRPPSGDRMIRDRLLDAGFTVTIIDDDDDLPTLEASGLDDIDLLVIASSVASGKVGDTFTDTDIPILTWENYLFDDLQLSNPGITGGTFTTIDIADPAHPLAGGRSGTPTVYSSANRLSYGSPTADADVIAHVPGLPGQAVIFGYETGDMLLDGSSAANKRVALFPDYNGARSLTFDGLKLVDAAIAYLAP